MFWQAAESRMTERRKDFMGAKLQRLWLVEVEVQADSARELKVKSEEWLFAGGV